MDGALECCVHWAVRCTGRGVHPSWWYLPRHGRHRGWRFVKKRFCSCPCKGWTLTVTLGSQGHATQHQTQERHTDKWTPLCRAGLDSDPQMPDASLEFSRIIFFFFFAIIHCLLVLRTEKTLAFFTGWLNKILRPEHRVLLPDFRWHDPISLIAKV